MGDDSHRHFMAKLRSYLLDFRVREGSCTHLDGETLVGQGAGLVPPATLTDVKRVTPTPASVLCTPPSGGLVEHRLQVEKK